MSTTREKKTKVRISYTVPERYLRRYQRTTLPQMEKNIRTFWLTIRLLFLTKQPLSRQKSLEAITL